MINIFVRQSFTEAGELQKNVTQEVIDILLSMQNKPYGLSFLTGTEAQSANSFKENFIKTTGKDFTPKAFRQYRLNLLDQADAFINIRTGLSESSTFELVYNIFKGNNVPVFFAIWEEAPIKTTLLRDLQDLCDITYVTFKKASELQEPLNVFLKKVYDSGEYLQLGT